jgi:predicted kinase
MEVILFVGIQATGKSSFYRRHFFQSHVRVSLDLLKTRRRERRFFELCLETGQPVVVDNTNPTIADRTRYIPLAREAGFRVVGYYFQSMLKEAIRRNASRPPGEQIPIPGIGGTAARLELPTLAEGFDALHYVRIGEDGDFVVEEWRDEVQ